MKRLLVVGLAAFAMCAKAEEKMSLAEAKGQIGYVVSDAAQMGKVASSLSAADQVSFLSAVNSAIAAMPVSAEAKAANYLNANRAAIKAASKDNMAAILAETFATVPPEALTVINERFATDVINRDADPKRKITDDQYVRVATNLMAKISARTAGGDAAGVRNAFAALMFIRASNGSPSDLRDVLGAMVGNSETQDLAKNEWFPAALGDNGQAQSYEPMLGAADSGKMPDPIVVLRLAGPQLVDALALDLVAGVMPGSEGSVVGAAFGIDPTNTRQIGDDIHLSRTPKPNLNPAPTPAPTPEPKPYAGQQ